jgi:hypothetical protein
MPGVTPIVRGVQSRVTSGVVRGAAGARPTRVHRPCCRSSEEYPARVDGFWPFLGFGSLFGGDAPLRDKWRLAATYRGRPPSAPPGRPTRRERPTGRLAALSVFAFALPAFWPGESNPSVPTTVIVAAPDGIAPRGRTSRGRSCIRSGEANPPGGERERVVGSAGSRTRTVHNSSPVADFTGAATPVWGMTEKFAHREWAAPSRRHTRPDRCRGNPGDMVRDSPEDEADRLCEGMTRRG